MDQVIYSNDDEILVFLTDKCTGRNKRIFELVMHWFYQNYIHRVGWAALFKTKKHQKRTKLLVKIQNHISRMILREYDNTVFSKWNIEIIGARSVCDLTAKHGQKYILTLHKQGEI